MFLFFKIIFKIFGKQFKVLKISYQFLNLRFF